MDTKKLRQKILDLAIRGNLVPQDPNDEPASVLLKRIRAEKERLIKEGKIKRSKNSASDDEIEAPFEIPESWEWVRLGDFLLLLSGQDFPPQKYNSEKKGIPYIIGASNIEKEELFVNRWTETPSVVSLLNDVLVVCKGAGVGKIAMNNVGDVHIARQIQAVRDETGFLNCQFIKLCIASNISNIIAKANGLIPGLKRELLLSLMIPVAPLSEQNRIVASVEQWYSMIDRLESNEGDLLKAIDKAKSKILDLAIHGKLVPQDPNDEPAIELLKRILEEKKQLVRDGRLKKKDLEGKPISEDEISFRIPESWEWVRLKSVTSKIVDGDHNPPHGQPNDSGYYMLSSKNIINDSIGILEDVRFLSYDDWKKCNERTNLTNGDVLLTTVATLGRSCVYENDVPYCFQRSVSVISTFICNYFLKFCFDSPYYQSLIDDKATGTAQRGFYINQLEESIIPIPPLSEQKRIVAKIEELFAVLDGIKESLE